MLLRLMLETCRTVEQALALARRVPIASAQTLTLADAGGAIAVLECNSSRLEVVRRRRAGRLCVPPTRFTPLHALCLPGRRG